MRDLSKLFLISFISGSVLALSLKLVQLIFGVHSYVLLFNMDYIPILRHYNDHVGSGYIFHYLFCLISVPGLYELATLIHLERRPIVYLAVYTIGSGILYFLTALTNEPPEADSFLAWFWWVLAHALFGIIVGMLVKKWLKR